MKLKNDEYNKYFYSKLGRKISKQNILLYRWTHKKKLNRPSSVSPALSKIKYLYKINQLKNEKKFDDNDNDIFSIELKEKQKLEDISKEIEENKENIKEKKTKKNLSRQKKKNYFFYKKDENKNKLQPSCTKYNPRYDIIFRRSDYTPSFKSMLGRKDNIKHDHSSFYLKHNLIKDTMAGKTFIDFSKQTKRNSIFDNIEEKVMENISNILKKKSLILKNKESFENKKNKSALILSKNESKNNKDITQSKNTINQNNNSDVLCTNNSNDSYDLFKHIYLSKIKKKKSKRKNDTNTEIKKIKSVDFNQMISREDLEKLTSKQISIVPYLFPNFSQVRDRPIMMVQYENKENDIKNTKSRQDIYISMNDVIINDKSSSLNKMHTPNFKLMKSRPDDDDPYPSYMRGVYDKNNCFKVSSESLKSINYSNSKFIMPLSSIWKNNSFNKYTNLKMIKSKKNLMDVFLKNDRLNIDIKTKKLFNFYRKNYTDFIGGKTKYNNIESNIFKDAKQKLEDKNIKDLIKDLKESI